ncbi:unnamed protein product [Tuber aestivum]|uniref:Uncharacterized protein n=1 Tax=Tuber aestivum TaxID=59557 RepID=A0A292Q0E1_9PEZI|nr:unnamed protein product [Tuber aestivum]
MLFTRALKSVRGSEANAMALSTGYPDPHTQDIIALAIQLGQCHFPGINELQFLGEAPLEPMECLFVFSRARENPDYKNKHHPPEVAAGKIIYTAALSGGRAAPKGTIVYCTLRVRCV